VIVPPDPAARPDVERLTAWVRGSVQGVGFRWWVCSCGRRLKISGTATNLPDGRVEVVAEGGRGDLDQLLGWLGEQPSTTRRPGTVTGVSHRWSQARHDVSGFREG